MAEKKQDTGFTVTDRRLFTSDGDLRADVPEEKPESAPKAATAASTPEHVATLAPKPPPPPPSPATPSTTDANAPPPPTAAEQQANADAYRQSSKDLDQRVELSGHSAKELEMTFERFMASLYMRAMLRLGLMREEGGEPRVDLIGARQTIDTLSLISEK